MDKELRRLKTCLQRFRHTRTRKTVVWQNSMTFWDFQLRGLKMRKLVATQQLVKEKGTMIELKCERELRKLESTIYYYGKDINKGGGRDRGDFLLKLK